MKKQYLLLALLCLFSNLALAHEFKVQGPAFLLDGKPLQILSGEMHYQRIPRANWRDRLRAAKAMGLNSITTYIFWNKHEPTPGVYDFSGDNDVAEFIREAQEEGLYVLLRPGPYVCAEWEFGGFPAWLLKKHDIKLRTMDPDYIKAVKRWFNRLGQELAPLQLKLGGPILAVQVENEYGSFGTDQVYLSHIRELLRQSGFTDSLFYTSNPGGDLVAGSLPDAVAAVNFGGGDAAKSLAQLQSLRPNGPVFIGEYWAGWFDQWGDRHHKTNLQQEVQDLSLMLSKGASISFYMFHGGTNFGWMNGANSSPENPYLPYVTSYDYDAPLDESGRPTAKYYAFQKLLAGLTKQPIGKINALPAPQQIPSFALPLTASIWENLPKPVKSKDVLSMEDLGQAYGYILYRTTLPPGSHGDLKILGLHDYARIYLGGQYIGSLDRRKNEDSIKLAVGDSLDEASKNLELNILVENSGRANYSETINHERKGILDGVLLNQKSLQGWHIFSLPMKDLSKLPLKAQPCTGPCFHQGHFVVSELRDSFLDTRNLGKGMIWINGRALGRFWNLGPQQTLYVPASWLKIGKNTVTAFDLIKADQMLSLQGLDSPILDGSTP